MPKKKNFRLNSSLLFFLLMFWTHCDSQVDIDETINPPDGSGGDGGGAFFALRSCHQLLHGDSGEFFSPDYLCSNPPLWCNWTIKVDPGKRIHLNMEDLTPDDTCHLKQDQLHVDEPAGLFSGHKVLQKCWREAKFTSSSNTLYVVLLIGGQPNPPYRGFHGRYLAFGPPVVYNPLEGPSQRHRISEPSLGVDLFDMKSEQEESDSQVYPESLDPDLMSDYYDQHAAMTSELPWEEEDSDSEVSENQRPALVNFNHIHPFTVQPTAPTSTHETSRSERDAEQTPSVPSDMPWSPQQETTTPTPAAVWRNMEEDLKPPVEAVVSEEDEEKNEETEASDQTLPPSEGPEPEEPTHPHPNMVELLTDYRGDYNVRNRSESPHLPGDHLFEVGIEATFQHESEESWDQVSKSLKQPVKTLINQKLESLHRSLLVFTKRIKRLRAGALFIFWLQVRKGPPHIHETVHFSLPGLESTPIVNMRGKPDRGVIVSVSIADVNECGTQMMMCDINADCVNQFGSYLCRCKPGFRDTSRIGEGGTVCADTKAAGCSSGVSAETKGVYVLFFLLSCLIFMLLAVAGMLYHRHHRGAFLVRCRSNISLHDPNNNRREGDPNLTPPPPPPPARSFREGWPQVKEHLPPVDLPLLRFSPLLPQEGG
ncbi:uncharacterized protein LOC109988225 isoform X1 [Xyrichtys novacula]|uniref:Uncharacterized protein LOC109988225 isoform X1 n=1 Tax=Xyrichtys novacula TaxID=13765 RepID=A0AAV1EW19_XYRNO|nr:uncharacterized protein LOC109988225 isoform X1 [Xyrichtys novacula]